MNMSSIKDSAGGAASRSAAVVQQSRGYQQLVRVGLVAYGLVHILLGWIALQLALGRTTDKADKVGALRELGNKPFGKWLLIITALGLFALVIWQAIEAAVGYTYLDGKKRLAKRAGSALRAVAYLGIGTAAWKTALGQATTRTDSQQEFTAKLLTAPGGKLLAVLLALAIVGVGGYLMHKALKRTFTEDLVGSVPEIGIKLGVAGHVAKGFALFFTGFLLTRAAFDGQAGQTGLDGVLRTLRDEPFGRILLVLMAAGFAAYGLYCFYWSNNARYERGD
jgi:hypothetical protein